MQPNKSNTWCILFGIQFSAISNNGANIAVAGRTGVAIYSMITRKWKLFGNETQEKDFIVTGGLLWWDDFIIMGCYSLVQKSDEIRLYPKDSKLDNRFAKIISMAAPVMLINLFKDQLVTFTADGFVTVFAITKYDSQNIDLLRTDVYDIRGLCIHPACIISVTMTNLKNDSASRANQGNQTFFFFFKSLRNIQQTHIHNATNEQTKTTEY